MATAGCLSGSWINQEGAQQRQGTHKNCTNLPNLVERRHRVVVAARGHGNSSRLQKRNCEMSLSGGALDCKKNPSLFFDIRLCRLHDSLSTAVSARLSSCPFLN
jgi:hypothetical protein